LNREESCDVTEAETPGAGASGRIAARRFGRGPALGFPEEVSSKERPSARGRVGGRPAREFRGGEPSVFAAARGGRVQARRKGIWWMPWH
jgi:hypothetical protein